MKTHELPEGYKMFTLSMSDRSKYTVDGEKKNSIMDSPKQFIKMPNGSIINKAHIVAFHFESEMTKDKFKALPEAKQKAIMSSISEI